MPSTLALAMSVTNPHDVGLASGLSSTTVMADGAHTARSSERALCRAHVLARLHLIQESFVEDLISRCVDYLATYIQAF